MNNIKPTEERLLFQYKLYDSEGNCKFFSDDSTSVLQKSLELLLKGEKVKIDHGPGLLWYFDPEKSLDPKGEYHTDVIPPFFWDTLDDEIKAKLK